MSNSPGKKDKAALWVKRQDEDREAALHAYILEHHPDYAGWLKRRNAHRRDLWQEAERRYPQKRATPEMLTNRLLYVQHQGERRPGATQEGVVEPSGACVGQGPPDAADLGEAPGAGGGVRQALRPD